MRRVRLLILGGLLAGLMGNAAQAQATLFDSAAMRLACLSGQCEIVVGAEIQGLQANNILGSALNSQIGSMAALLFDLAQQANGTTSLDIARAMAILAEFSNDATQRSSILQLANAIADGSAELFNLDDPFAVSPN